MSAPRLSRTLVALSCALAVVVTATSLLGLLAAWTYAQETVNWRLQGQGQDVGNLVAVVVLAGATLSARRGSRRGFEVWLGTLLYLAYAFAIYAFAVHFGPLFLAYIAAFGLSAHCLVFGLSGKPEPETLGASRRVGGWVITGIAVLFALLWLGSIVPATLSGQAPSELAETGLVSNPVQVLDLALVLPGMALTAALARRGRPTALLLVVPWLVFSSLMGASIVAALMLTGAPLAPMVVVGTVTLTSAVTALTTLTRTAGGRVLHTIRERLRMA